MKLTKMSHALVAVMMAFLISPIPNVAAAEMISTSAVLSETMQADVQDYFQNTDVQQELIKRGLSPEEVSARLATLSPDELNLLSSQVQQARAGGDILVTVLLVVLIIFLIKRI